MLLWQSSTSARRQTPAVSMPAAHIGMRPAAVNGTDEQYKPENLVFRRRC